MAVSAAAVAISANSNDNVQSAVMRTVTESSFLSSFSFVENSAACLSTVRHLHQYCCDGHAPPDEAVP